MSIWNFVPTEPTLEAEVSYLIDELSGNEEQQVWKEVIPASWFTLLQKHKATGTQITASKQWTTSVLYNNQLKKTYILPRLLQTCNCNKISSRELYWEAQELIVSKYVGELI